MIQGRRMHRGGKWARMLGRAALLLVTLAGAAVASAVAASGDVTTVSFDNTRVGWRQNQAGLTQSNLPSINEQFNTPISGSVYGQPLVVGSTVIVATETDVVYGLDRNTGDAKWATRVGNPEPSGSPGVNCPSTSTFIGVTGTPVLDPATGLVYLTANTWNGANPQSARWFMYALNASTGAVQPGWPVQLSATASNDLSRSFNVDAPVEFQRTGMLLLNGRIYAAFASYCDQGDYDGWIVSVSTSSRSQTGWVDEGVGPQGAGVLGGIWQSGGGLVSDGSHIFFASGNGTAPPVGPGTDSTPYLGQSVVRLNVGADGTLSHADHFAPADAQAQSNTDADLGSSGPVLLPPGFGGVVNHQLLFQGGKSGVIYLLDANNLGGQVAPGQPDNVVAEKNTNSQSTWGHAAAWGGDGGGWLYLAPQEGGGALHAFRASLVNGRPTLSVVGQTADTFGGLSGSPVITSNGTASGGVLWVLDRLANTSDAGSPAELRAYNPVPVNGSLQLLKRFPISSGTKFSVVAADGNQVFLGTEDGHVSAYSADPSVCTTYNSANGPHQLCGAMRDKYQALGGPTGILGPPTTDEIIAPDLVGKFVHFSSTNNPNAADGSIYWSPSTGAQSIHGLIRAKWASMGWERSVLGYPTTDEQPAPGRVPGRFNDFANSGSIYWSPATGPWSIHGLIWGKYRKLGGPASFLGFPVTDETGTPDGIGRFNHFTSINNLNTIDGSIYWTPRTGAWSIHGSIRAKWASMGWETGFLSYPVSDETAAPGSVPGRFNDFANSGSIYWSPATGPWSIHGLIWGKYRKLGGPASFLGFPVTDETGTPDGIGRFNHFTSTNNPGFVDGSIYWTPSTGPWSVHGTIRNQWAKMGWETSCLHYPISDEFGISGGRQSNFQGGNMTYSFSSGQAAPHCH